ncbi:MAG: hypothetical protein K6G51_03270 [Sphaerochaetaceae bacterium]|nr:hypothetical protein [Sphaerochaetaceae bacterium]
MKSLKKIQKVVKVMKTLTTINFVLNVAAIIICIPVLVLLFSSDQLLSFINKMALSMVGKEDVVAKSTAIATVCVFFANCVSSAIICRSFISYYKRELELGTPFTKESADDLSKLGRMFIFIPLITDIVCSIGLEAGQYFYPEIEKFPIDDYHYIYVGLMLLFISLLCRSVVEQKDNQEK